MRIKADKYRLNIYKLYRRKDILDTVKMFYVSLMKQNLPIYGVVITITKLNLYNRDKRIWESTQRRRKMLRKVFLEYHLSWQESKKRI
jgi:hypothetical protein